MPRSIEEFIIYSLVGIVSVIITRLVSRRSENVKNTMDIFRHYHSHDLLGSRNRAWKFMNTEYKENPVSFDQLFSTQTDNSEIYDDLAKVIYFWMSLYVLKIEGGISVKVAKKLFSTQYKDWEETIRPLYEKTKNNSKYTPDWFMFFENENMSWLKNR